MLDREYLKEAGLRDTDLPPANHPLLENNDEIRDLSDLIDARENVSQDSVLASTPDADSNLDIENALTLPHKRRQPTSADLVSDPSGFDADVRTASEPDDEDDASYMTRADVEASMLESDPDPSVGMDDGTLEGAPLGRAADFTGTVQGIMPGTATHVPVDLGGDGFQIEDEGSENSDAGLTDDESDSSFDIQEMGRTPQTRPEVVPDSDGPIENDHGVLPVTPANPSTRDDALDATRTLQ